MPVRPSRPLAALLVQRPSDPPHPTPSPLCCSALACAAESYAAEGAKSTTIRAEYDPSAVVGDVCDVCDEGSCVVGGSCARCRNGRYRSLEGSQRALSRVRTAATWAYVTFGGKASFARAQVCRVGRVFVCLCGVCACERERLPPSVPCRPLTTLRVCLTTSPLMAAWPCVMTSYSRRRCPACASTWHACYDR